MNRKEAAELSPIIQAFSEGKPIQYRIKDNESAVWTDVDRNYHNFSPHSFQYRIKPKPKYRSFKNAEECWNEMQKHQPFGWVKDKKDVHHRVLITAVGDGIYEMSLNGNAAWSLSEIMNLFTFADSTPFGVKVEE